MSSFRLTDPAIAIGGLVVITGCTGFIGSHIVDQALAAGYKVRGITRDVDANEWLVRYFVNKYGAGRFELVAVPDMEASEAYSEAVRGESRSDSGIVPDTDMTGASGFIHVAHDMRGSRDAKIAIPRTIKGAINALEAAAGAGIERFVYTSSSFAVTQPKPDAVFTVYEDTYNEEAVEAAERGTADGETVYSASKVLAERAIQTWVTEHRSNINVNFVCPNGNIGPMIDAKNQGYPTSAKFVAALAKHEYESLSGTPPQHFINVQDCAKLHIIALVHPDLRDRRIFGMSGPFNLQDVVESLRRSWPDEHWDDYPDSSRDKSVVEPSQRVEQLLQEAFGHGYVGLDESVWGNARDILG